MEARATTAVDYDDFAAEVREFALSHCPPDVRALVASNGRMHRVPWARWQRVLFEHGWGAPNWPVEHGGTGWDPRQRVIFEQVTAECDCPPQYHHGLRHLGPVLIEFGTVAQQQRYLPPILTGDDWWCQGYSEPGAGSDLAALRTRAERRDDVYVVNGQKIWTSHAHESDLMYTLVRTSDEGRKQQGITMLLIPLDAPGISIRPIRTIDGWHHVNEVFLDDVEVPVDARVGAEGEGWSYGKFLLQHERLGSVNIAPAYQLLQRTRGLVERELADDAHRARRDALLLRLVHIEAEMAGQRELGLRAVDDVVHGRPLGLTPSVIKVTTSRIYQEISEVALDVVGSELAARMPAGAAVGPEDAVDGIEWLQNHLYMRSRTIFGGSDEIQKNIIASSLFGS